MEDSKPGEERRSSDSRLRRSLIRLAIRAQDAKDLAQEVKMRIEERFRLLMREHLPTDPPQAGDGPIAT
jgi:hypothetical protein